MSSFLYQVIIFILRRIF